MRPPSLLVPRGFVGPMSEWELTVEELKARRDRGERLRLIDVREPWEHSHCRIPGSELIPLMSLPTRTGELQVEEEIVVYCHTGNRSANAVAFLRQRGYGKAKNLAGGIDAWAARVDPTVPRY